MDVAKELTREDGDGILLVVDVRQSDMRIHVVCKRLVSNLQQHG